MLRDVVVVAVGRTRPRSMPLAMLTIKTRVAWIPISMHFYNYGAPLSGPSGRRSSVKIDI